MEKTYFNARTGIAVSLEGLNAAQQAFFAEAVKRFRANTDWLAFDEFVFGAQSVLFAGHRSYKDVLQSPLYVAIKDMSLQLGVQQGKIAEKRTIHPRAKGEKAIA
jgi:hypothetical protein